MIQADVQVHVVAKNHLHLILWDAQVLLTVRSDDPYQVTGYACVECAYDSSLGTYLSITGQHWSRAQTPPQKGGKGSGEFGPFPWFGTLR